MKNNTIKMGCGKGKSCSIGVYLLPYHGLTEKFNEYVKERKEQFKKDKAAKAY